MTFILKLGQTVFTLETKELGKLYCKRVTNGAIKKLEDWFKQNESESADGFARYFITLVCKKSDEYESDFFDESDVLSLKETDIEAFSKRYLEKNRYLFSAKYDQKKSQEIETGLSNDSTSDELLKTDDESFAEYLRRSMVRYIKESNRTMREVVSATTQKLFSASTIGLLEENQRISDQLKQPELHISSYMPPQAIENPFNKTNEQLSAFGKDLKDVSSLIENMNKLAIQMAIDSETASRKAHRWSNIMFGLGLITLIVTAVFSYMSYSSSNDSSLQLEKLIYEQNLLLKEQLKFEKNINSETISSKKSLNGIADNDISKPEEKNSIQ